MGIKLSPSSPESQDRRLKIKTLGQQMKRVAVDGPGHSLVRPSLGYDRHVCKSCLLHLVKDLDQIPSPRRLVYPNQDRAVLRMSRGIERGSQGSRFHRLIVDADCLVRCEGDHYRRMQARRRWRWGPSGATTRDQAGSENDKAEVFHPLLPFSLGRTSQHDANAF